MFPFPFSCWCIAVTKSQMLRSEPAPTAQIPSGPGGLSHQQPVPPCGSSALAQLCVVCWPVFSCSGPSGRLPGMYMKIKAAQELAFRVRPCCQPHFSGHLRECTSPSPWLLLRADCGHTHAACPVQGWRLTWPFEDSQGDCLNLLRLKSWDRWQVLLFHKSIIWKKFPWEETPTNSQKIQMPDILSQIQNNGSCPFTFNQYVSLGSYRRCSWVLFFLSTLTFFLLIGVCRSFILKVIIKK